jgi:membrane protease YdiL (CAAX protease family)
LGPIFSYIRIKSGSVVAAAILHGSLNAFAGLPLMLIKGGNDLTSGVTGVPGFFALLIIVLVIFLFDRSVNTG